MRIVLVNWAKIWDGASNGGGVNGYCLALALALRDRGHEVISLFGGVTYVPPSLSPARDLACQVRRHEDWLGIKVFEVVNSPVVAPSIAQFQNPAGEVSSPELERVVREFFDAAQADVVHFHNVEGFSAGCIATAKAAGSKVVYSLHNYHTICPQVYLMQGHRVVCRDADNGHNCARCIETRSPAEERTKREAAYLESLRASGAWTDVPPPAPTDDARAAWKDFRQSVSWMKRAAVSGAAVVARTLSGKHAVDPVVPPPPLPGAPVSLERGLGEMARAGDETRGKAKQILGENTRRTSVDPGDPSRLPLLNVIEPEPASLKPPNAYAERRAAMVKMLNSCDRVLAVSNFVRDKFVSMGVDPGVIEAMPIGSRIGKVVELASELVAAPPAFRSLPGETARPVRLVFMGYNHYYKGLHILVEALNLLRPEELARLHLSIFALDGQSIEWMFRRLEPRTAGLVFIPGYDYHDIPWMLGGKDLGVVSSVWWDNAPQTVFEFFACGVPVLGAAVGGIPDFVHDGVNGLLFRGNDPADMASRLSEVVAHPERLWDLRKNVRPPKTIEAHGAEIEELYAGLTGRGPGGESRPGAPTIAVDSRAGSVGV
jgi:glycosyltransferase involved in cell wall biosynthesis